MSLKATAHPTKKPFQLKKKNGGENLKNRLKYQKNGNVHEYVYYRCTRKSKTIKCTEPAITEPELAAQLSDILQGYALPKSWAQALETMLVEDERKAEQSSGVFISEAQTRTANLQSKL